MTNKTTWARTMTACAAGLPSGCVSGTPSSSEEVSAMHGDECFVGMVPMSRSADAVLPSESGASA